MLLSYFGYFVTYQKYNVYFELVLVLKCEVIFWNELFISDFQLRTFSNVGFYGELKECIFVLFKFLFSCYLWWTVQGYWNLPKMLAAFFLLRSETYQRKDGKLALTEKEYKYYDTCLSNQSIFNICIFFTFQDSLDKIESVNLSDFN